MRTYSEHLPGGASQRILQADGGNGPAPTRPFAALGNPLVPGDNRDNAIDSRHHPPNDGVGFLPCRWRMSFLLSPGCEAEIPWSP